MKQRLTPAEMCSKYFILNFYEEIQTLNFELWAALLCVILQSTLCLCQANNNNNNHTQTHKRIKTITQRGTQRMETQEEPNGQGPRKGKSTTIRKRRVDYYTAIKKLIQIHTSNVNLRFISCFPSFVFLNKKKH